MTFIISIFAIFNYNCRIDGYIQIVGHWIEYRR